METEKVIENSSKELTSMASNKALNPGEVRNLFNMLIANDTEARELAFQIIRNQTDMEEALRLLCSAGLINLSLFFNNEMQDHLHKIHKALGTAKATTDNNTDLSIYIIRNMASLIQYKFMQTCKKKKEVSTDMETVRDKYVIECSRLLSDSGNFTDYIDAAYEVILSENYPMSE